MAGKEIRINGRRFEVYDWMERFTGAGERSPHTGETMGIFWVTLANKVAIGSLVTLDGDRYGIVESVSPARERAFTLGQFEVSGPIIKGAPAQR